jgi:hypothetical protein
MNEGGLEVAGSTYTAGAWDADAAGAAAARIDPAALSVIIAGMMMARPIRMTPPWCS